VHALRFANGIVDSVLVKYCATQLAFFILSRPVFGRHSTQYQQEENSEQPRDTDSTKIMEDYSRNSGYLINLSQAVGRLVLAGRDLTRFAGYTSRVSELLDVLEDVEEGHFQRQQNHQQVFTRKDELKGRFVEEGDAIEFDGVPITTPSGDTLIESMTFTVKRGMNCLITGPNGCGKSSMFRILGDLWPLHGGTVRKPPQSEMFYVPQRPYLPLGTLRHQIIYPDQASSLDDAQLLTLLERVHLGYLVEREGGWDAVRDWTEVLSGGEKQRVAMARLFYHRPMFAVLDECTSAVSIDVEGDMYEYAKLLHITLFTISHRPSLFRFHDHLIRFDGHGGYTFQPMTAEDDPFAFGSAANGTMMMMNGSAADGGSQDGASEAEETKSDVMFYYDADHHEK
jgi:ATP-binding cassette subfamily D (ALD) protein 3